MLKSNDITITYGLSISRCVTVRSSEIMADVGDPVGRKAYWPENSGVFEGDVKAGYRN